MIVSQSIQDAKKATKQDETIFNKNGKKPLVIAISRRFRGTDSSKLAPIFVRPSEGTDSYKEFAVAKTLKLKGI